MQVLSPPGHNSISLALDVAPVAIGNLLYIRYFQQQTSACRRIPYDGRPR